MISVTTHIDREHRENPRFKELQSYLSGKNIFLDTGIPEKDAEDSVNDISSLEVSNIIVITHDKNVKSVVINQHEIWRNMDAISFQPIKGFLNIQTRSFTSSSTIYINTMVVLLKLDTSRREYELDFPHIIIDISGGDQRQYEEFYRLVTNAGKYLPKPASLRPSDAVLIERFTAARFSTKEFPLLDDGRKILPGTKIYGGRGFFFDADGFILDLKRINNTGNMGEDWSILCGFEAVEYSGWKEVEGLLDWVVIYELATSLISDLLPPKPLIQAARPMITAVNREVMEYCARHPKGFDHLTPDAFEALIAGIYENNGFYVERIGKWNQGDGGVDILAIRKDFDLGEFKVAIQCKHYQNTISPSVIRELNGTIDQFQASMGVVATTSSFSDKSYDLVKNSYWRIKLEDRNRIVKKLENIFKL